MTEPIHFDVRYGIIKVGLGNRPLIHRAPVITCAQSQRILLTKFFVIYNYIKIIIDTYLSVNIN